MGEQDMAEDEKRLKRNPEKPANVAPDAVKDPNEKTQGKPGAGPEGGGQDDEADPGGG